MGGFMDRLDIRNYLYHGIHNGVYKGSAPDPGLAVFESILKDEYLLFGKDLNERDVYSEVTYYTAETGLTPRISLGFYPLNEEVYKISLDTSRYKDNMPKSIRELLINKYGYTEEELNSNIMNFNPDDIWFAWLAYSRGITLIFDPNLLKNLKIADCAGLYDEICIEEKVSLRKYLVAVSLFLDIKKAEDYCSAFELKKFKLAGYEYECLDDKAYLEIKKLLRKYNYDVPVVDFLTGKPLDEHGKVLVRVNKNKNSF